jgi:hypothetical protein
MDSFPMSVIGLGGGGVPSEEYGWLVAMFRSLDSALESIVNSSATTSTE